MHSIGLASSSHARVVVALVSGVAFRASLKISGSNPSRVDPSYIGAVTRMSGGEKLVAIQSFLIGESVAKQKNPSA